MISPKCFDKGIILRDLPIDFFPVIVVVSQRCMNGGGFKLIFPHDLFDAHLPLIRYEQQPGPGLAVRKYVMMRRGIIAHETLRKPGATLTAAARAEVDYLLSRLARKDPRARV